MTVESKYLVYDERKCELGEGALWHPELNCLFWFDILSKTLNTNIDGEAKQWNFAECVSAAAWIDKNSLLISCETGLCEFSISTGDVVPIIQIEAENSITRSNDGRADRQHGFWVSTMGKNAENEAGAIYRFCRGEVRKLHDNVTIPNSICFSPNGEYAYFTDTPTKKIMRQALDQATGWPISDPDVYLDFTNQNGGPDGAVTDENGNIWVAFWGRGCVEGFDPSGNSVGRLNFPATQTTCPAFGGQDFKTLFVTSAMEGLGEEHRDASSPQGKTFYRSIDFRGLPEPNVVLK
jgi:sugar lactone lactonase YvrE